jgi:hypothetical protein
MNQAMTGDRAFTALLFPPMNSANVDYLRSQYVGVESIIDPREREFAMRSREEFEKNFSNEAMEYARKVAQHYLGQTAFGMSYILVLQEVGHFQTAAPHMQRWIMACPRVRELYHGQCLDGYSHSYTDSSPNLSGWLHDDYRMVMQGIVEDDDSHYGFTTFAEDGEEAPLNINDQATILSTWDWLTSHIEEKDEDPTSVNGDKM